MNTHKVYGITFRAVKYERPIPHWRCQLPSGEILEAGVLDPSSRPKMWAKLDDIAERIGETRFHSDFSGD